MKLNSKFIEPGCFLELSFNRSDKVGNMSLIYKFLNDKSFYQLFENQVKDVPDKVAMVCGNKQTTYKELDERSNQLARYLKKACRIKTDDLIAGCLDQNEYMLITMLGIFKAGGAYVPIDLSNIDKQVEHSLLSARARVFVFNEKYTDKLSAVIDHNIAKSTAKAKKDINILAIDSNTIQEKLFNYSILAPRNQIISKNITHVNLC